MLPTSSAACSLRSPSHYLNWCVFTHLRKRFLKTQFACPANRVKDASSVSSSQSNRETDVVISRGGQAVSLYSLILPRGTDGKCWSDLTHYSTLWRLSCSDRAFIVNLYKTSLWKNNLGCHSRRYLPMPMVSGCYGRIYAWFMYVYIKLCENFWTISKILYLLL
jgi:hypothetical protein